MTYLRDGRAPIPKYNKISKVMSANKYKDTGPELILRKVMWKNGIRGYRLHWKKVPGRPDIAFPGKKIAIFVNGCFWHRCPHCNLSVPKTNSDFWKNKFAETEKTENVKNLKFPLTVGPKMLKLHDFLEILRNPGLDHLNGF